MIVIGRPHRPLILLQLKDEAAAAAVDQAASSSPPVHTLRWVNRAVAQQSATHQQGARGSVTTMATSIRLRLLFETTKLLGKMQRRNLLLMQ